MQLTYEFPRNQIEKRWPQNFIIYFVKAKHENAYVPRLKGSGVEIELLKFLAIQIKIKIYKVEFFFSFTSFRVLF